jgi:hypothetical protein
MIPKKRVLLTAILVLVGLAASVAVAQAAIPIITDTTTPPSGHSTAACTECHVVTPTVPDVPGPGAGTPDASDESTHGTDPSDDEMDTVEGSDESTRGVEADDADESDNEADHHESATEGHGDDHDRADDAQDAAEKAAEKAHEASEHETVDEQIEERDHRDTPSVDHGGAQHDGSHQKAEGSSD